MKYAETVKAIPDVDKQPGQKGVELSKTPIDLKSGDWSLKLVPWIGGRVISMTHHPSGNFFTIYVFEVDITQVQDPWFGSEISEFQ
jgi:hypothetical protein